MERIGDLVRHVRNQTPFGYTQPSIQIALDAAGPGSLGTELIRKDLLHNLRVMLEIGAIAFAQNLRHRERLIRECAGVKASGTSADHDDLVIALALAAWRAKRQCSQLIPSKR